MDFISNQTSQIKEMLKELGLESIDELFLAIPESLRRSRPIDDDGLSEFEGMCLMESIAAKNTFPKMENYLGAGAYEHHVPALVSAICQKSEFLTAYTPYQAEVSQGMLQAIFEFQSAMCAMTGLDVANASMYDGASACAEGLLMTLRSRRKRKKVLIAASVHPSYLAVTEQYLKQLDVEKVVIPFLEDGCIDQDAFFRELDDRVAGVLFPYPNFFGVVEDLKPLVQQVQEAGALSVVCANPLVYGLYASAGELGADIAVGDCQPFGLGLNYGGPYAGYIACRQELVRQIPGRLVGETIDKEGKRGFTLTLQAREQHIRREKATSNICTNQALAALASLVTLLWYGPNGVRSLAETSFQRASYLREQLSQVPGISVDGQAPLLNEFVIRIEGDPKQFLEKFRREKIEPGLQLKQVFPEMDNAFLVAVTETKSKEQLDRYVEVARA